MSKKKESDFGFCRVFVAILMYAELPKFDRKRLLSEINSRCGCAELMDDEKGSEIIGFAFPDHVTTFAEGETVPSQCFVMPVSRQDQKENRIVRETLERSLGQTWDWSDAASVVAASPHHVIVTEMLASGLEYHLRLKLFRGTVAAVDKLAPCKAIHWLPSERVVNPANFRERYEQDALHPAVNVRLFNIAETDGDCVMDTLGLAAMGLPDLQCHFKGMDCSQVAGLLYTYADYIFENGDVIEDGNTIQGRTPSEKWKCRHEVAMVGPERAVLDINPGKQFAAGKRN